MKSQDLQDFRHYFPDFDDSAESIRSVGYLSGFVSVFNHWLSLVEADECRVLTYETAKESGHLKEYYEGERRFIDFYQSLAITSRVVSWNRVSEIIQPSSQLFSDCLVDSLREVRLMDLAFIDIDVRVLGGYDRTDLILVRNKNSLDAIEKCTKKIGLHVLYK